MQNANTSETVLVQFKGMISPIKAIPSLLRILEETRNDKDKNHLLSEKIPELLKICDAQKKNIFSHAKKIDKKLITYLNECYEFNEVLLENQENFHSDIYQYEKLIIEPIQNIIQEEEEKEEMREQFIRFFEPAVDLAKAIKEKNNGNQKLQDLCKKIFENNKMIMKL